MGRPTASFPDGGHIRHFRLMGLLGSGGMGEVYRAYDEKLERDVALKCMRAEQRFHGEARARFLREARLLSQLAHPGICQIFDLLDTEEADVLVLELIEGQTLRAWMKQEVPGRSRLRAARELAEVLVAAHAKGIVHRDLKPDNVMVSADGHVKVLDFGIARSMVEGAAPQEARPLPPAPGEGPLETTEAWMETAGGFAEARLDLELSIEATSQNHRSGTDPDSRGGSEGSSLTRVGMVLGTLAYMSPEQAAGDFVTAAADLYSLGLIFQELFTGQSPHGDAKGLSVTERLARARTGHTRPVTGIDADLAVLIERMKAVNPVLRPTAVEVVDRLRAVEEKPFRRRRRILTAAALVALAAFSTGMGVQAWKISREKARAAREAETSRKALEFVSGLFDAANPEWSQGKVITARDLVAYGLTKAEELKGQPLLQASVLETLGYLSTKLGQYPQAEQICRRVLSLREGVLGPVHPDVADTLFDLGNVLGREGRFNEAEAAFTRALQIRERALGTDHPKVAKALLSLATIHRKRHEAARAEALCLRAQGIFEKAEGPEAPDVAACLNQLANLYNEQGDYAKAEPLFQRALAIRQKVLGPTHPDTGASFHNLALLYKNQGQFAKAEPLLLQSLRVSETALGPDHPETRIAIYDLGCNAALWGRKEEALRWLEEDAKHGEDDAGMAQDDDLASLRGDPRFQAVLATVRARAEAEKAGR